METIDLARHWGRKAAQTGMKISENPYRGGQRRSEWLVGFGQMGGAREAWSVASHDRR